MVIELAAVSERGGFRVSPVALTCKVGRSDRRPCCHLSWAWQERECHLRMKRRRGRDLDQVVDPEVARAIETACVREDRDTVGVARRLSRSSLTVRPSSPDFGRPARVVSTSSSRNRPSKTDVVMTTPISSSSDRGDTSPRSVSRFILQAVLDLPAREPTRPTLTSSYGPRRGPLAGPHDCLCRDFRSLERAALSPRFSGGREASALGT